MLINQYCIFPHTLSLTFSLYAENQWLCGWSPVEMLPVSIQKKLLPPHTQLFWPLQVRNLEEALLCTESHTPPFTWTHLLHPYSPHYPHCFADCLLSPVLAQPAMEGVEVRWRPAVGSTLAPLSLCSWLLCASGVFVTVSLCLWCCVWPLRFAFLKWSLSILLPYDVPWIYDVFRSHPATLNFPLMFLNLSLLIIYYRRYTWFSIAGYH